MTVRLEKSDSELGLPPAIESPKSPALLHEHVLLEVNIIGSVGARCESWLSKGDGTGVLMDSGMVGPCMSYIGRKKDSHKKGYI